ncbi:MAG: hypothetical protein Q8M16_12515 [Pirellulaceae bacterium]|nr:hypothetical protein [Pirellulaceae bacterium]
MRPQPSPNEKSRNLAAERASLLPDSLKNRDNEESNGNRRSRGLGAVLVARLVELRTEGIKIMDANPKQLVGKLIDELAHQRDELKLKLHLGSVEAKEQLGKLEERLFQLRQRHVAAIEALDETSAEVWDALKLLGSEIQVGFDRIWKSL